MPQDDIGAMMQRKSSIVPTEPELNRSCLPPGLQ
jgi:hypothetical protein